MIEVDLNKTPLCVTDKASPDKAFYYTALGKKPSVEIDFKVTPLVLLDKNNPAKILHFATWEGLSKVAGEKVEKPKPVSKFIDGNKLVSVANSWIGKDFNPGQTAQCANFVRAMLKEAGFNIGVTEKPSDGLPPGIGYANGFAGDDIGLLIKATADLLPGDIVLFKDTYGDWPAGTITHVGIYTGNGYFVHRPTSDKPVVKADMNNYGHWREGRRLYNNG